jgi:hypothetical protein
MTLSGTVQAPSLQMSFPPPVNLQLDSSISTAAIGLNALPDIPISDMKLTFTGNTLGPMFVATCFPAAFTATLTPWSGIAGAQVADAVQETGCPAPRTTKPGKPTVHVSFSRLADGAPRLSVRAVKGRHAPEIQSLWVRPPAGLMFSANAVGRAGRMSKGALTVTGAQVGGVRVRHGLLKVRFKQPTPSASMYLSRPLLVRSPAARHSGHPYRPSGHVTVVVTDSGGLQTKLALPPSSR